VGRTIIKDHIISAAQGEYGNFHRYPDSDRRVEVFVSPLMLYWLFDASAVNDRSLIAPLIKDDDSIYDSWHTVLDYVRTHQTVKSRPLPY